MKIIVSHDVDHLYPSDHIAHDLIFPKLWIRSLFQMMSGRISQRVFMCRLKSIFDDRLCRIPEIIAFDISKGVKSTFYFGMANILGMSYAQKKTPFWINYVKNNNLDVGVHGVEIDDIQYMKREYEDFLRISGLSTFGIRTHYVRYNTTTFAKMNHIGYLYDTSEFDKKKVDLKKPYKIGNMWEFPLYIMDGYIMNNNLCEAKKKTIQVLEQAENEGINYFTFLFHDYMFNDRTYPLDKEYYEWFIEYCIEKQYQFVSYLTAVTELEKNE